MTNSLKIILETLSFIIVLVTGVILTKNGKPYNSLLLTFHKLLSLASIVFLVLIIKNISKSFHVPFSNSIFMIIGIISFLFLLITGGVLSSGSLSNYYTILRLIHGISTITGIASATLIILNILNKV